MPLPVDRQRIDDEEVVIQQPAKGQPRFIIDDLYGFRVAAVRTDVLIGRSPVGAVGVPGLCAENAVKLVEKLLQTPETAPCEIDGFHDAFLLSFLFFSSAGLIPPEAVRQTESRSGG